MEVKIDLPHDDKSRVDLDLVGALVEHLKLNEPVENVNALREYIDQISRLMSILDAAKEKAVEDEKQSQESVCHSNGLVFNIEKEEPELRDKIRGIWKPFEGVDGFYHDGFYPQYLNQPLKILFVGREAWGDVKGDYIQTVGHWLTTEEKDGGWNVNLYPFHRRQFYMAYGLISAVKRCQNNGNRDLARSDFPAWKDVPWAEEMAKKIFAKTNGEVDVGGLNSISWAFMNLSKICNSSGSWETDYSVYTPFVQDHQEQIKKEIKELNPHLIIGANVYELVSLLEYGEKDARNANCHYYYNPAVHKDGHVFPPLLNCYHFSAIKKEQTCFYDSVMDVLMEHAEEWLPKHSES